MLLGLGKWSRSPDSPASEARVQDARLISRPAAPPSVRELHGEPGWGKCGWGDRPGPGQDGGATWPVGLPHQLEDVRLAGDHAVAGLDKGEIGRASCRERV